MGTGTEWNIILCALRRKRFFFFFCLEKVFWEDVSSIKCEKLLSPFLCWLKCFFCILFWGETMFMYEFPCSLEVFELVLILFSGVNFKERVDKCRKDRIMINQERQTCYSTLSSPFPALNRGQGFLPHYTKRTKAWRCMSGYLMSFPSPSSFSSIVLELVPNASLCCYRASNVESCP